MIDDNKTTTTVDWGKVSADYAKYRDIYPDEFYDKVASLGLCTKGQRVLDLGTGTGVFARNMSRYGASFTGADISENQIKYAKLLTEEAGLNIDYQVASSENFSFADKTFDTVTACQCFWYFNTDIAIPKIYNVLKEGGHLGIFVMSWLPGECAIARQSEQLILEYNPSWKGANWGRQTSITTEWVGDMFEIEHDIAFDVEVTFTRDSWHGRLKACRGIGASDLTQRQIAGWEEEHLLYMQSLPESFNILHYCTMLSLKKKA